MTNRKVIVSGTQANWLVHQNVIDIVRYSPGANVLDDEIGIT